MGLLELVSASGCKRSVPSTLLKCLCGSQSLRLLKASHRYSKTYGRTSYSIIIIFLPTFLLFISAAQMTQILITQCCRQSGTDGFSKMLHFVHTNTPARYMFK